MAPGSTGRRRRPRCVRRSRPHGGDSRGPLWEHSGDDPRARCRLAAGAPRTSPARRRAVTEEARRRLLQPERRRLLRDLPARSGGRVPDQHRRAVLQPLPAVRPRPERRAHLSHSTDQAARLAAGIDRQVEQELPESRAGHLQGHVEPGRDEARADAPLYPALTEGLPTRRWGLPQALTVVEALIGSVFLVTLVARLVTLWVRQDELG